MTAHERTDRHDDVVAVLSDLKSFTGSTSAAGQLIALGPDVIGEGDLIEVNGREWLITLHRMVVGVEVALLRFSDSFAELLPHDRYVTLERHGESRPLASPPRLTRKGPGAEVRLTVDARYPRPHVDSLPSDISLEDMSTIGGREQLPQIFLIALSTERGELLGSPDWGTHVRRRFAELGDTPIFERVLSLEAMRQASIPFVEGDDASATPLRCVERIISLKLSSGRDIEHRRASIVADVNGIGRWEGEVEIPVARSLPEEVPLPSFALVAQSRPPQFAKGQIGVATADSNEVLFLPTIATLRSKEGTPVQPLLWMLVAKFSSIPARPSTRTEQHAALTNAIVHEDADFQRKTRWPRVLVLPGVQAEHLTNGAVVWRHAYRTGAVNEVGDEQLSLDRDGRLSFQRATFWDMEMPALDFGMLAFDCIVFMRLAGRYAVTLGAPTLDFDVRFAAPQGANEVLALFHGGPIVPEQRDRTGRLRRPTARGSVVVSRDSLGELDQLVAATKRLLDTVANEFELEPSAFSRSGPPFLAIDSESLGAMAKRFR